MNLAGNFRFVVMIDGKVAGELQALDGDHLQLTDLPPELVTIKGKADASSAFAEWIRETTRLMAPENGGGCMVCHGPLDSAELFFADETIDGVNAGRVWFCSIECAQTFANHLIEHGAIVELAPRSG